MHNLHPQDKVRVNRAHFHIGGAFVHSIREGHGLYRLSFGDSTGKNHSLILSKPQFRALVACGLYGTFTDMIGTVRKSKIVPRRKLPFFKRFKLVVTILLGLNK